MVEGLAILALDKHSCQPALFAAPLTTTSAPSARSLLPVPVVAGHTQSAPNPPPEGQKSARVRDQGLM